ncbi:MAG: SWIM zinc finger family protein [Acidimicrobiales bacterium]
MVYGADEDPTARLWDAVVALIGSQIGFQARFGAGEVPEELVAAAADQGIELFPLAGELTMACSCPDSALPCKHLAAVFYQVAAALAAGSVPDPAAPGRRPGHHRRTAPGRSGLGRRG